MLIRRRTLIIPMHKDPVRERLRDRLEDTICVGIAIVMVDATVAATKV
jgi:hypothetical protein